MKLNHFAALLCISASIALTGCGSSFVSPISNSQDTPAVEGAPFQGNAMGGQQPIGRSHLYIFAASTLGYGGASTSLILPYPTGSYPSQLDGSGNYYVATDYPSGNFNLALGQYACIPGQQIYLLLTGGDVGNGANSAISEMASMGTCTAGGGFSQLTGNYVFMNEVSTVAAAYAFAGFATDTTHIATGVTPLAAQGLQNAFNTTPNIYNINAGAAQGALAATPQGSGVVPQDEVNSIADMLASCINSSGSASTNCSTLFANATTGGTSPVTPSDTANAVINIAHNPGANVANLFTLFTNTSPFQPTLTTQPPDYSVVLAFNTGTGNNPAGIAIDATGNLWITNHNVATITELSNIGAVLSGSGYTDVNMIAPIGIAIDTAGNAWVADEGDSLLKFTASGGTATSVAYTGDDLDSDPQGVAIDASGYIWVAQNSNTAVKFAPTGAEALAASSGDLKSQLGPQSIAIDPANSIFIANYKEKSIYDSVSSFDVSGSPRSTGSGFGYSLLQKNGAAIAIDATGRYWNVNSGSNSVTIGPNDGVLPAVASGSATAGLSSPQGIALDGSGRAWIVNNYGTVSVLDHTGAAITSSGGYSGTLAVAMSGLSTVAIDASGNVWAVNTANGHIYEFVGAATPVVTPLVDSLTLPNTPAAKPL